MTDLNNDDKYSRVNEQIDIPLLDTDHESRPLENQEALDKLNEQTDKLIFLYACVTSSGIGGLIITPFSMYAMIAVFLAAISLEYFQRIAKLRDTMTILLGHFGENGITIVPRVKTNSEIIDLFIKMPDKRSFAILLRTNGNCKVKWRENKQQFYIYKPGKGSRQWDALSRAGGKLKSIIDLKANKNPLLGTSRADRDRTITRAVVLFGDTTIHPDHELELSDYGRTKALRVYKGTLFYVLEREHLIDFLQLPEKT
jgi:hypothetical protein